MQNHSNDAAVAPRNPLKPPYPLASTAFRLLRKIGILLGFPAGKHAAFRPALRRFSAVWILLLAVGCASAEPRFVAFGDSLTSEPYSWANQFNELGMAYVQVHAQAGRRLVDWGIPGDLVSKAGQRAIVYLGANDAGSGVAIEGVAGFRAVARERLWVLKERGFDPVVVLPPLFPFQDGAAEPYRAVLVDTAGEFGLQVIDPLFPFDDTLDGVHPNRRGHFWLAASIALELGL